MKMLHMMLMALCLLGGCINLPAQTVPKLSWSVETSAPSDKTLDLRRGEVIDLECKLTSYAAPMDLNGCTVTLHATTNNMPGGQSYQVSGSVIRMGVVGVRVNTSQWLPANFTSGTWTLEVAATDGSARIVRASGQLKLSGLNYPSTAVPVPVTWLTGYAKMEDVQDAIALTANQLAILASSVDGVQSNLGSLSNSVFAAGFVTAEITNGLARAAELDALGGELRTALTDLSGYTHGAVDGLSTQLSAIPAQLAPLASTNYVSTAIIAASAASSKAATNAATSVTAKAIDKAEARRYWEQGITPPWCLTASPVNKQALCGDQLPDGLQIDGVNWALLEAFYEAVGAEVDWDYEITIPDMIDGQQVVAIGDSFSDRMPPDERLIKRFRANVLAIDAGAFGGIWSNGEVESIFAEGAQIELPKCFWIEHKAFAGLHTDLLELPAVTGRLGDDCFTGGHIDVLRVCDLDAFGGFYDPSFEGVYTYIGRVEVERGRGIGERPWDEQNGKYYGVIPTFYDPPVTVGLRKQIVEIQGTIAPLITLKDSFFLRSGRTGATSMTVSTTVTNVCIFPTDVQFPAPAASSDCITLTGSGSTAYLTARKKGFYRVDVRYTLSTAMSTNQTLNLELVTGPTTTPTTRLANQDGVHISADRKCIEASWYVDMPAFTYFRLRQSGSVGETLYIQAMRLVVEKLY